MKETSKKKINSTLFWSGLVSAGLIFAQNVAVLLGFEISQETMLHILATANSFLAILSLSGVLVDNGKVDSFQKLKVKTNDQFKALVKKK